MTATVSVLASDSAAAPADGRAVSFRRDLAVWLVTVATLLAAYLLLQNPYWVPGGDSEVYTAAARNIALGKGYTFNGQPVSMVPPGWSLVMAGVMKISPSFLLLKLVTMSCMLGSLAMWYWICRRFASPALSATVVLLSGILSHVYVLTIWLHSDALFCLLSTAALLLALQINQGRPAAWRGAMLVLLCAAAVTVRWAALLSWMLVAAALLHGQLWPRLNDAWKRAFVTGLVTLLAFVTVRAYLAVSPEIQRKIREFGGVGEDQAYTLIENADQTVAVAYRWMTPAIGGTRGYLARAAAWGNWFSYLLWQPLRLGGSNRQLDFASTVIGWTVIVPLLIQAWRGGRQRQWIWIALILYSALLAMNWPHPNARYLVPVAPLIILGVFKGVRALSEENWLNWIYAIATVVAVTWVATSVRGVVWMAAWFVAVSIVATVLYLLLDRLRLRISTATVQSNCTAALRLFAGALLLCNGALYAVDVHVARSEDFYARYDAGMEQDLISAGKWLGEHPVEDVQIGVCERYVNMGRVRTSRLGLRVTSMLTGKAIVSVPMKYLRGGDPRRNPHFLNWARMLGVKYVLYQPDVSPWRVFHFRMGWLQEIMTGDPALDTGAGWRLYYIPAEGDEASRVSLTPTPNWPTRVPGL